MSLRIAVVFLLALCAAPLAAQTLTRQAKLYSPLRGAPPINGSPNYPAASYFGSAMSVSGATAAISEREPYGSTLIRMFDRDGAGLWTTGQAIVAPSDLDASQQAGFGQDYALDGQRLAMVVQGHQGPPLVIVFEKIAGTWQEAARIDANLHVGLNGSFGQGGVALSGDTLAIGSPGATVGAYGVVHVFVRAGETWVLQQIVSEDDPYPAANFGNMFELQGDRLVINRPGARFQEHASSGVYVFERSAGVWNQQAKLTQPPSPAGMTISGYFGNGLALDGERLAILDQEMRAIGGASYPFDVVRIYERDPTGLWPLVASLDTGAIHQGNPAPLLSIALRGSRLLAGQVYLANDLQAGTVPRVFLFEFGVGGWSDARALTPFDWDDGWTEGADNRVRYGVGFGDRVISMGGIALDDRGAALIAARQDALGVYQYPPPGAVYLLTDSTDIFCNGFEDDDPALCTSLRAR